MEGEIRNTGNTMMGLESICFDTLFNNPGVWRQSQHFNYIYKQHQKATNIILAALNVADDFCFPGHIHQLPDASLCWRPVISKVSITVISSNIDRPGLFKQHGTLIWKMLKVKPSSSSTHQSITETLLLFQKDNLDAHMFEAIT